MNVGCCDEIGCRRKKPPMLMRSDLTGVWYVVLDYTDMGGGSFRANRKHPLPDNQQAMLNEMRAAHSGEVL